MASGSISIQSTGGGFKRTSERVRRLREGAIFDSLEKYAAEGVAALAAATPVEDGSTAAAWSAEVRRGRGYFEIVWKNSVMAGTTPLVILLQYGHGTGTGGYVQGRDFINPSIKPIFEKIKADVRKAVKSA